MMWRECIIKESNLVSERVILNSGLLILLTGTTAMPNVSYARPFFCLSSLTDTNPDQIVDIRISVFE